MLGSAGSEDVVSVTDQVEHGKDEKDLPRLKSDLESRFHDVMRFKTEVSLVPEGTLQRTATKTKLIEKNYEQKG